MSEVLRDRDTNVPQPTPEAKEMTKAQPKSMEYHRQVLEKKLSSNESVPTFKKEAAPGDRA